MKHLANHYYHVYNHGVAKQNIFANDKNYQFLLKRILLFIPKYELTFIAYCLMPNHYHFLFRLESNGQLAPFIQRLFNSYTQAFNRQQNRTGTLFESRAKSKYVDTDEYVLHFSRYIHLNPVEAGLVAEPVEWPYSSYKEWIGIRPSEICDTKFVRQFFRGPTNYATFVGTNLSPKLEKRLLPYYFD